MEANTITKLFTLLLAAVVVASCVQDDEFDAPSIEVESIDIPAAQLLTIGGVRTLLETEILNTGNQVLTFNGDEDDSNDQFIVGYVISNDAAGNFFEEILIQDHFENPTAGVKVLIDANPLSVTYQIGRKVFVRLEGLTVGFDSGVLALGLREGNRIEQIGESAQFDFMLRDDEVESIVPLSVSIADFTDALTNVYVRLSDVQFNRNDALGDNRKTYAAEASDEFDGERLLESCTTGASVIFSTSTFADFKGQLIPDKRGNMDAILTKDFFGETFNIVLNDPSSIAFDSLDRCDPDEIDCGIADITGPNEIFTDFFETQSQGSPIAGNGWTNYSEAGTASWEAYFDDGTNASLGISARVGSFSSGDDSTISWLITPEIDFDAEEGETLNFKTSNSFSDGSILELFFSSDWDGTEGGVASATWDLLPAAYIVQDDDFFGDWFNSGNVNLSCINGSGYIAWKYVGSGEEEFDGTYELDEIEVKSN